MLTIAVFVAILFNAMLAFAMIAYLRRARARSETGSVGGGRIAAVAVSWSFLVLTSIALVSTASTTVRTAMVMAVLDRKEPFRTIMRTDPPMRTRIEDAVGKGIERGENGNLTRAIEASVRPVVQTYMADKLAHAPDASIVEMGRMTLAGADKAAAASPDACAAMLAGDAAAMRTYMDEAATAKWLRELIRSEPVARPNQYDQTVFRTAMMPEAIRSARLDPSAADTESPGFRCDLARGFLRAATALPQDRAAAGLRSLGIGSTFVVR